MSELRTGWLVLELRIGITCDAAIHAVAPAVAAYMPGEHGLGADDWAGQ